MTPDQRNAVTAIVTKALADIFDALDEGEAEQPTPAPEPTQPTPEPEPPVTPPVEEPQPADPLPAPTTNDSEVAPTDPRITLEYAQARINYWARAISVNEDAKKRATTDSNRNRYQANIDRATLKVADWQAARDKLKGDTGQPAPEPTPAPGAPEKEPDGAIVVSDATGFARAIEKLKSSGGAIVLRGGDYGTLAVREPMAKMVRVMARSGEKVTMNDFTVAPANAGQRAGNVELTGIHAKGIWVDKADNVAVLYCVAQQLKFDTCDGVAAEGNRLAGGQFPLRVHDTAHFDILGNVLEGAREDSFRITGYSNDGRVEANHFLRNMSAKPMHGDHIQMFGDSGGQPHNIVIRDNLIHDNPVGKEVVHFKDGNASRGETWKAGDKGTPAPAQGIFAKDGPGLFEDIMIQHNLIRVGMVNAIYTTQGGSQFDIIENIVLPVQGANRAVIRLAEIGNQPGWNNSGVTVSGNICPAITNETPEATVEPDNWAFGTDVSDMFEGISSNGDTGNQPEHWKRKQSGRVPAALVDHWLDKTIKRLRAALDAVPKG